MELFVRLCSSLEVDRSNCKRKNGVLSREVIRFGKVCPDELGI